jgi:hypothetical protein
MKRSAMRLLIVCGAIIIPVSHLIQGHFGVPVGGLFGFVIPSIAAGAVLLILIYLFVTRENQP